MSGISSFRKKLKRVAPVRCKKHPEGPLLAGHKRVCPAVPR